MLVVEKSTFNPLSKMSLVESEAFDSMYEQATYMMTSDGGIQILAGSTVGGGTRINWGASLRTPPHVIRVISHNSRKFGTSHLQLNWFDF